MSPTPPWGADRPLELQSVESALAEAFSDLDAGDIQALGSGWDFDTFGIGLRWVARFPRRAEVAARLDPEIHTMPSLSDALRPLGIEVPDIHGVAPPTSAFPYSFLIQRRIWGLPLSAVGPSRFAIRLAAHLAKAFSAVHALDVPDGVERGQGDEDEWLAHATAAVAELSPALRERVPTAVKWIESAPSVPAAYAGPPRLLHNDMSPDHIRVARTGLGVIGILDWSDMAGGDPARDFATLYSWGGGEVLKNMLPAYTLNLDPGFRERVTFMARVSSVAWLRDVEVSGRGDLDQHVAWTTNAFSTV
jgi:aminoglycoside phosphotransferase (APT) family kinase protein